LEPVEPSTTLGCEDCLESGGQWVHLRLCMQCGHAGCCDSSPNKHATAHFRESEHPVVQSLEPGEHWAFCYADDEIVNNVGAAADRFKTDRPLHLDRP